MINIGNDWDSFFEAEQQKEYYKNLRNKLSNEYATKKIYPPKEDIFNTFKLTPIANTKVIILGQDCYHGYGQAMGLSFSVRFGIKEPPSLKNIHKEISSEDVKQSEWSPDLTRWATQGVLLLNSILTVEEHKPLSHASIGWMQLTDNVISLLDSDNSPKVFMLWGGYAQSKSNLIKNKNHLILKAVHPSPLSAHRGWFGCNHFKLANEFLVKNNLKEIEW